MNTLFFLKKKDVVSNFDRSFFILIGLVVNWFQSPRETYFFTTNITSRQKDFSLLAGQSEENLRLFQVSSFWLDTSELVVEIAPLKLFFWTADFWGQNLII